MRDKDSKPIGLGSGFFVDANGLIVTNYHVIEGAESATVRLSKGATLFVDGVAATYPDCDLALLKVSGGGFPFLKSADGSLPKVGSVVFAIGNPRGLENTFSGGMVSGHRQIKEGFTAIQVTTPISPGSSGGPLLNASGDVVGVTAASFTGGQNLNFAVPVAAVQRLIQRQGKVQTLASARGEKIITLDLGNNVTMKLVLVPPGKFMMGSPKDEMDRGGEEGPQREVKITKPFYMGVYEVTQEQYEQIIGKNPSNFKGAQNPVEKVSWDDAVEFCTQVSQKTGMIVRLPTEAEWEYACRAGSKTPFNTGETISTDQANYDGNYFYGTGRRGEDRQKTIAVGSFKPNAWGLYDMHGNLWEWCADWCDKVYYANAKNTDPQGPASGWLRVVRGGCWRDDPQGCRSANRGGYVPASRGSGIGFRVVVDLK